MASRESLRWRKFKRTSKLACRFKLTMPDFLEAIRACAKMRREGGERTLRNPLIVYECDACGGIHVGHLAYGESILMSDAYAENIRELQGVASESKMCAAAVGGEAGAARQLRPLRPTPRQEQEVVRLLPRQGGRPQTSLAQGQEGEGSNP
jgi:hypothetical protein